MTARSRYALRATRPRAELVERLSRRLPRVALEGVLDDLDRSAEPCPVPGDAAGEGLTWDGADRDDPSWWPQGVASTCSGRVLIVSWYARRRGLRPGEGSRISIIDRTHPGGPRYRHVLLVAPRRRLGVLTMGAVRVHAGGIAVQGDVLYVADTLFGVRLFRLSDVLRVPCRSSRAEAATVRGRVDGLLRSVRGVTASGYGYVLPQCMALRIPLRLGAGRLRHSFLSIGSVEGRPNLVVGEYRRAGQAPPRLARYLLESTTGLPATDERGWIRPLEVHDDQPRRMQGAAVHGSTWFLTASSGEGVGGDLYVGSPHAWVRFRRVLPPGPEDLDWSRPGDELWCVSEWPGRRWVFPIATGRWQRPLQAPAPSGRPDRPCHG